MTILVSMFHIGTHGRDALLRWSRVPIPGEQRIFDPVLTRPDRHTDDGEM